MHRRRWSQLITLNGGNPYPHLEDVLKPILEHDIDPLIKRIEGGIPKVQELSRRFESFNYPEGWTFINKKNGVPQVHLTYQGNGFDGTPFLGETNNIFLCIATRRGESPTEQRMLYMRDLPFLGGDPLDFEQEPYNQSAAWFTLFVWGNGEVNTAWRCSHEVLARLTLEGEAFGTDLTA